MELTNLDTKSLHSYDQDIRLTHTFHGLMAKNIAIKKITHTLDCKLRRDGSF